LLLLSAPIALLADEVASAPLQYALLPLFLVVFLSPMAFWLAKVATKNLEATHRAMTDLQEQLEDAVRGAEEQAARREAQVQRQQFETHLANALEMADGETEVVDVVRRALQTTLPDSPVEMLLADNSHAHEMRPLAESRHRRRVDVVAGLPEQGRDLAEAPAAVRPAVHQHVRRHVTPRYIIRYCTGRCLMLPFVIELRRSTGPQTSNRSRRSSS
jgi:hypothetical protein